MTVVLEGEGMGDILGPPPVMLGFEVLFTLLAAAKFPLEDIKAYYG
jgi:hypothetical protein